MTSMTIFDHVFFLAIAVAQPIVGYISFNRLVRRVEAGETISPSHLYDTTMAGHWSLFAVLLAIWFFTERSWDALGFGLELNAGFLAGLLICIAVVVLLWQQLLGLRKASSDKLEKYRGHLGRLEFLFPRNGNELARFYVLSLTAGIVEETIWRGFVFWYMAHVMPLWAAAIVSAVGFGLAHAYQGASNVPKIILVGAVFAALYYITGSLWLPMILHAVFDMLQGRTVYELLRARRS